MGDPAMTGRDVERADRTVSAWWQWWGGMSAVPPEGQRRLVEEIAQALSEQRESDARIAERLADRGRAASIADAIRAQ